MLILEMEKTTFQGVSMFYAHDEMQTFNSRTEIDAFKKAESLELLGSPWSSRGEELPMFRYYEGVVHFRRYKNKDGKIILVVYPKRA